MSVCQEDRGGMQELVALIKQTRTPVICIANDAGLPKMKTLRSYCDCITWKRVPAAQIAPRILEICEKEGLDIDRQSVEKVAESTHGDIRQILNFLQMWRKGAKTIGFDQVKSRMTVSAKDFDLGAFDVVPELFKGIPPQSSSTTDWISERTNLYFMDADIIPLFIQDNYLRARPALQDRTQLPQYHELRQHTTTNVLNEVMTMDAIAEAADSISMGDLIGEAMFSEQDWSLQPCHAMMSTIYPAYLMRGGLHERLNFPAYLGKQSTRSKNLRITREFRTALSVDLHVDTNEMAMAIMPQLRTELLTALQGEDTAVAIATVIEQLDQLGLDKEEFDALIEWGEPFVRDEAMHYSNVIPKEVKAALTRAWKAGSHLRKVSRGVKKDSSDVSKSRTGGAAFAEVLDDNDNSNSGDDEKDDPQQQKQDADDKSGDIKEIKQVTKKKTTTTARSKKAAPPASTSSSSSASAAAAATANVVVKPKKPRAPAKPKVPKPTAAAPTKKIKGLPAPPPPSDDDDDGDMSDD